MKSSKLFLSLLLASIVLIAFNDSCSKNAASTKGPVILTKEGRTKATNKSSGTSDNNSSDQQKLDSIKRNTKKGY